VYFTEMPLGCHNVFSNHILFQAPPTNRPASAFSPQNRRPKRARPLLSALSDRRKIMRAIALQSIRIPGARRRAPAPTETFVGLIPATSSAAPLLLIANLKKRMSVAIVPVTFSSFYTNEREGK
jgi:hypothetical protein